MWELVGDCLRPRDHFATRRADVFFAILCDYFRTVVQSLILLIFIVLSNNCTYSWFTHPCQSFQSCFTRLDFIDLSNNCSSLPTWKARCLSLAGGCAHRHHWRPCARVLHQESPALRGSNDTCKFCGCRRWCLCSFVWVGRIHGDVLPHSTSGLRWV